VVLAHANTHRSGTLPRPTRQLPGAGSAPDNAYLRGTGAAGRITPSGSATPVSSCSRVPRCGSVQPVGGRRYSKPAALDAFAVIVSAPGETVDFVSRFFAPGAGIPEDPVTGSAHCTLVPYWAARLGKSSLTAKQLSPRGGDLSCRFSDTRVLISGSAVEYLRGEINIVV
jgi:hypothetical protein